MTNVQDILNDVYPIYKQFHQDKDMAAYNEAIQQIAQKHKNDFCTNLLLILTPVVNTEMEEYRKEASLD